MCNGGPNTCGTHQKTQNKIAITSDFENRRKNKLWSDTPLHLIGRIIFEIGYGMRHMDDNYSASQWVGEWLIKFNIIFRTAVSEFHPININRVVKTYTLEFLSSLTKITHNLKVTINLKRKMKWKKKFSHPFKFDDFLCVTLKFDGWPWKIIGHRS